MKKCPHIEQIFEELNQNSDLNESNLYQNRIEKICSLLLEINHFGQVLDCQNQTNNQIKNLKFFNCENCTNYLSLNDDTSFSRLHLCASCLFIGCFSLMNNSHIEQHSLINNHIITIDITYGAFYCFECKDFQYNQNIEEFLKESFLKQNFLPHGI